MSARIFAIGKVLGILLLNWLSQQVVNAAKLVNGIMGGQLLIYNPLMVY